MKKTIVSRLVKSEDLNHHGTLFAGRAAEWFIEACFIAGVQTGLKAEGIVCYNVHGFKFLEPAQKGDIVHFKSYIVRTKNTSYTVYCKVNINDSEKTSCEGFVTFVYLGKENKKTPHFIVLDDCESEEERLKREEALSLN